MRLNEFVGDRDLKQIDEAIPVNMRKRMGQWLRSKVGTKTSKRSAWAERVVSAKANNAYNAVQAYMKASGETVSLADLTKLRLDDGTFTSFISPYGKLALDKVKKIIDKANADPNLPESPLRGLTPTTELKDKQLAAVLHLYEKAATSVRATVGAGAGTTPAPAPAPAPAPGAGTKQNKTPQTRDEPIEINGETIRPDDPRYADIMKKVVGSAPTGTTVPNAVAPAASTNAPSTTKPPKEPPQPKDPKEIAALKSELPLLPTAYRTQIRDMLAQHVGELSEGVWDAAKKTANFVGRAKSGIAQGLKSTAAEYRLGKETTAQIGQTMRNARALSTTLSKEQAQKLIDYIDSLTTAPANTETNDETGLAPPGGHDPTVNTLATTPAPAPAPAAKVAPTSPITTGLPSARAARNARKAATVAPAGKSMKLPPGAKIKPTSFKPDLKNGPRLS